MYLIENSFEDKDSINKLIKEKVIKHINNRFFKYVKKIKYKYYSTLIKDLNHSIQFYEYYKTSGFIPFGEVGTVHFIENKEDSGGFRSELLQHYSKYKMAVFSLCYCKNETIN